MSFSERNLTSEEISNFEESVADYQYLLTELFGEQILIPYVHVLKHASLLIKRHGNIGKFSCQGMEHKNKWCKGIFHRLTNMRTKYLEQILTVEDILLSFDDDESVKAAQKKIKDKRKKLQIK